MLILSRKTNECVVIDGRITVKIVRVDGEVVKIGIEAPADVPVHRLEVYEEIQRNNREAVTNTRSAVPKLPVKNTNAATPVATPA
ncbi:MAG TPA: carbon storage regulator CsrA [Verrucomicrobiae bacterium]